MLENYLNQTCTLRHAGETNNRGQPTYSEPVTVKCRLQQKHTVIQKSQTETISAENICYLIDAVYVGDTINGCIIHAVNKWVGLDGSVIGFKAVF